MADSYYRIRPLYNWIEKPGHLKRRIKYKKSSWFFNIFEQILDGTGKQIYVPDPRKVIQDLNLYHHLSNLLNSGHDDDKPQDPPFPAPIPTQSEQVLNQIRIKSLRPQTKPIQSIISSSINHATFHH